jgi:hypothetical protein
LDCLIGKTSVVLDMHLRQVHTSNTYHNDQERTRGDLSNGGQHEDRR